MEDMKASAIILDTVGKFTAALVSVPGTTEEDTIRIAAALMSAAEMIFRQIGGGSLAAQQFYLAADRCASPAVS